MSVVPFLNVMNGGTCLVTDEINVRDASFVQSIDAKILNVMDKRNSLVIEAKKDYLSYIKLQNYDISAPFTPL